MAAGEERRKNALILSRVRGVQRAFNLELALKGAVAPAWVAVSAIALCRLFLRAYLLPASGVMAVAAVGVWLAWLRTHRVRLRQAAVLADRQGGFGGLLLTRLEVPVGEWELELNERARLLRPPPVRTARSVSGLGLAALFLALALWVPLPALPVLHRNAAAAGKLAQVEAKAQALAKEHPLDEATQSELSRLEEELAKHRFDAADWEAADGVESALEAQAAQAASELSRAEEAARALEQALGAASGAEGAAREQEELERALQALSGANGAPGQQGSPEATAAGKGNPAPGSRSSEQVSSVRKALQQRQQELARAYGQQQGGTSSRQAGRGGKGREDPAKPGGGPGGEEQGPGGQQSGTGSAGHASRNAKGGPGRGGGEGELQFGELARMDPDRLKFAPLPKGQGGEAEELWGLQAANPRVGEVAPASFTGAAAGGQGAPGFKDGPRLPRNRELLRRYFDSTR